MPRQNPFQQLRAVSEGPEAEFEAICAGLIKVQFPNAKRVRVHRGDGGVDTAHGAWGDTGALDVFQVKYFPDVLGSSQRQQIRESYLKAFNNQNFKLRSWLLCLPVTLRQEDHEWFDTWKSEQETHIDLWDGDKLEMLLRLPGAAHIREKLKGMSIAGLPAALVDLYPTLYARLCDPAQGTAFLLQIELKNRGDAAAENVRCTVKHTRETAHRAHGPFPPWKQENQEYNPWVLSFGRTMNPGERGAVLSIPFGSGVPRQGRVEVKLGSKTTSERTWYGEASEADILANKEIQFTPDTPPWPAEQLKLVSDEPQFAVAKQILESILAHPEPETRGLTVIQKQLAGQVGITFYYTHTGSGGSAPGIDSNDLKQAVAELVSLGWLKPVGTDGTTKVYRLAKQR